METAMSESMGTFVGEELLAAQIRGANAERIGNRDVRHAPQGVYRCAGHDRWLAISVTSDAEWQALCEVAQLAPSLTDLDTEARRARHDTIDAAITAWTSAQSPRPAMERLQVRGVIAALVSDGRDLVEDPHLAARDFWAEVDQPEVGRRRYPGNPITLSETPVVHRRGAPMLGEHNAEVFGGLLGLSVAELEGLQDDGVIADEPPSEMAGPRPFG